MKNTISNTIEEIETIEEEILCLREDLFQRIPFKRSQAHCWGDDQDWIDKWETETELLLNHKENLVKQGYLNLCK